MPSSTSNSSSTNQQQFVVQAIVNSVTRCFQPGSERSGGGSSTSIEHARRSPVPANNAEAAKSRNARNSPTKQSPSPTNKHKNKNQQYDADRYIHRKLEIFRTTDEDCIAAFGIPRPRPSPSSSMKCAARRSSSRSKDRHSGRTTEGRERKSNTLVSSSDEEISNLANNQKRMEEQEERESRKKEHSDSFVESFFKIMQDPLSCIAIVDKHYPGGGLCFANPVRMAETENVSDLSDWRLTTKEFTDKYYPTNNHNGNTHDDDIIPDVIASSASEEATMTSASYFDQKYSHIIEKNPPIPLFREHLVEVSENNTNGVVSILERRRRGGGGGRRANNESPQSSKSSRAPVHVKVKKNSRSTRASSVVSTTAKSNNNYYDDSAPPIGKSSSVSTQSTDDEKKTSSPFTSSSPSIWQRMCNNGAQDQRQRQPQPQSNYRETEFVYSQDTMLSQ